MPNKDTKNVLITINWYSGELDFKCHYLEIVDNNETINDDWFRLWCEEKGYKEEEENEYWYSHIAGFNYSKDTAYFIITDQDRAVLEKLDVIG